MNSPLFGWTKRSSPLSQRRIFDRQARAGSAGRTSRSPSAVIARMPNGLMPNSAPASISQVEDVVLHLDRVMQLPAELADEVDAQAHGRLPCRRRSPCRRATGKLALSRGVRGELLQHVAAFGPASTSTPCDCVIGVERRHCHPSAAACASCRGRALHKRRRRRDKSVPGCSRRR